MFSHITSPRIHFKFASPSERLSSRSGKQWDLISNQRDFFEQLGDKLGVKQLDDWYSVLNVRKILSHGGTFVNSNYKGSPIEALKACYPEHKWIPWKFGATRKGFWKSLDNQKMFFDWFGKEHGLETLDDWYSIVNVRSIISHGGNFLGLYNGSATEALKTCYPEHNWVPWKFPHLPNRYWSSIENQTAFFDWLGHQLGVKQLDDWYHILSAEKVKQYGGEGILRYHKRCLVSSLIACYPDHNWIPWKFQHCATPKFFWDSQDNLSRFLSELSNKLEIQTLDDWYRVDTILLQKFGASHIIKRHGGLFQVLCKHFPHHPWNLTKFNTAKKAQRWLLVTLRKIFPNEEILEDYMHPQGSFQLDAFIPSQSLAFEFHGRQHYQDTGVFQPLKLYQERDAKKRLLCEQHNIKLIEVPYWWNRTQEELEKLIQGKTD